MKLYQNKKFIPVCVKSWEEYMRGDRETLEVRLGCDWVIFRPPCARSRVYEYQYWTHTYSPNALKEILHKQDDSELYRLVERFRNKERRMG
jgi:hypothetical protein